VDKQGKLRWARNGELVDSSKGKWKDLGQGRGIGPADSDPLETAEQAISSSDDSALCDSDSDSTQAASSGVDDPLEDESTNKGFVAQMKNKLKLKRRSSSGSKKKKKVSLTFELIYELIQYNRRIFGSSLGTW